MNSLSTRGTSSIASYNATEGNTNKPSPSAGSFNGHEVTVQDSEIQNQYNDFRSGVKKHFDLLFDASQKNVGKKLGVLEKFTVVEKKAETYSQAAEDSLRPVIVLTPETVTSTELADAPVAEATKIKKWDPRRHIGSTVEAILLQEIDPANVHPLAQTERPSEEIEWLL